MQHARARAVAISAVAAPFGLFAVYIAYLVVPEVLRVVVPAVVEAVTTR
jgi:hypothetical protein